MMKFKKLNQEFYSQELLSLAKNLLGKYLVVKLKSQQFLTKIVEVEAYNFDDKASHSFNNHKTPRNQSMFLLSGHVYVYFIYGLHHCLNVVSGAQGVGAGILIRALDPLNHKLVTTGPGRLCKALKIDKTYDGCSLIKDPRIFLATDQKKTVNKFEIIKTAREYQILRNCLNNEEIIAAKRINIDYAEEHKNLLWRFYLKDNQFVSKKIKF